MSIIKEAYNEVRYLIRDLLWNRGRRKELENHEFSIISSDCSAGCVCYDLKEQMRSPTKDLGFHADDYIRFCRNLDYYLSQPLKEDQNPPETEYLTATCGDVRLILAHYDSFQQASEAWERRKRRVNFENLFFLMNDRGYCAEEHIAAFDALPYANKVFFTHKEYPQYKSAFYLTGSECIMDFAHPWSIRRYYDQFDFVKWLNDGVRK